VRFAYLAYLAFLITTGVLGASSCSSSDDHEGPPAGDDAATDAPVAPDGESADVVVGDESTPDADVIVDGGPKCKTASCAIAIAAGPFHTCALLGDHTVKCWGDNAYAELGAGTVAGKKVTPDQSTALVAVDGLTGAVAIAGGGEPNASAFTCAILETGAVHCWGSNGFNQLGTGLDAAVSPTGNDVPADASATAIDLGYRHGCLLDVAGAIRCWGSNSYGERGTAAVLGAVPLEAGAGALSAGFYSTCAVTGENVVCFGYNASGQVNPASGATTSAPTIVDAGGPASAVSASTSFTCAMLDASVSCWGTNTQGQLGHAGNFALNLPGSPSFTPGLPPESVTAGGVHACAIMSDKGVSCWGANSKGQSGDFSGATTVLAPVGVGGVGGAVALALGFEHSCALTEDGDVFCWGSNAKGQLGPNGVPQPDAGDGGDAASLDAGTTDKLAHPDPVKVPL
jgi:alpha-tubulin suppressor-like RCC1 family protein